jgi:membrane protease YdiL (CAAX protease family)
LTREIQTIAQWLRLLVGLLGIYLLFESVARYFGSDREEAGVAVCAAVVIATLLFERVAFQRSAAEAARGLGLRRPSLSGTAAAVAICILLLCVVPMTARITGAAASVIPGAWQFLPGLFAQGGVAEELLFRGYLFGHLRRGRTFVRAAALSMVPFIAVHVTLFFTMDFPLALAALLLSIVLSVPLASLFELGGNTIWPPALLHLTVQSTVKVVSLPDAGITFPLAWMAASALLPLLVLLLPRRHADVTRLATPPLDRSAPHARPEPR